jgi:hypothetical protein
MNINDVRIQGHNALKSESNDDTERVDNKANEDTINHPNPDEFEKRKYLRMKE